MKKLVTILLLVVMCFLLMACGNSEKTEGPVQVQKITYSDGEGTEVLTSEFYFDYIIEEVDKAEYDNATEKLGEKFYTSGIIKVDGTVKNGGSYVFSNGETPAQLNEYVGKTYYVINYNYARGYYKITYTALHLSYLNITFVNGDTFEVSYYDNFLKGTQTLRIKTDNYTVLYFSTAK